MLRLAYSLRVLAISAPVILSVSCKTTPDAVVKDADGLEARGACALYASNTQDGSLKRSSCVDNDRSSSNYSEVAASEASCTLAQEGTLFQAVSRAMFKKVVWYPSALSCSDRMVTIAVARDAAPRDTAGNSGACTNFSGRYSGTCQGPEPGAGGELAFEVNQSGCSSVRMAGDSNAIPIDGRMHTFENFRAFASFDENLYPQKNRLRLSFQTGAAGVLMSIQMSFSKVDGKLAMTRKTTRSVPGLSDSEELLETCQFKAD